MRRLLWATVSAGLLSMVAGSTYSGLGREAQLFVVDAQTGDRQQLTHGQQSYWSPSWSRDSRQLAVVGSDPESSTIELVAVDGSARAALVRRRGFIQGLAWSPRGGSLAYVRLREGLASWTLETVEQDGSSARTLATHLDGRFVGAEPSWAPDGTRIVYTAGADTFVVAAAGGRPRRLRAEAWGARWSPDGRLVLLTTRAELVAAPVGGGRTETIVPGLIDAHAAWSPAGDQIAFSGVTFAGDRRYYLYLVSLGSRRPVRLAGDAVSDAPAWSPDGRSLGFATWDGSVRILTVATGEVRTLTRLPDAEISNLAWSPDGRRLAFVARKLPAD